MFKKSQETNPKRHQGNQILKAFLGFITGIYLAKQNIELAVVFATVVLMLGLFLSFWRRKGGLLPVFLCILVGVIRIQVLQIEEEWTTQIRDNTQISCVGRIRNIRTDDDTVWITLEYLSIKGVREIPVNHSIALECSQNFSVDSLAIHQFVAVTGVFSMYSNATNEGEFDYREYYRSIHSYGSVEVQKLNVVTGQNGELLKSWDSPYFQFLYDVKKKWSENLEHLASEESSGVLKAVFLGDKTDVSEETKTLYQQGGISHILAVSGLHISLFGNGLYKGLCWLIGIRWITALLSGLVMVSYCTMIGSGVGAVRATIGFLFFLIAQILGRRANPLVALSVAGFWILWQSPMALWQSGFQLSFVAMIGVHVLVPCMQMCMKSVSEKSKKHQFVNIKRLVETDIEKFCQNLGQSFVFAIAVQFAVMPVVLWHQYVWPLYGVFLNLLFVPFMGMVLLSASGCAIFGSVSPMVGSLFARIGEVILHLYEWVCKMVQIFPQNRIVRGRPECWQIVLWVTGLFLLICYIEKIRQRRKIFYFSYLPAIALPIDKRKGKKQSHSKPCYSLRMVILMLGFFGSLFWFHYVSNKGLEVTCLDVGQGDAIVCELPDKTVLCIDGGSSSTSHVGTQIIEPYLLSHGIDRVNHWVITHPDSDHYSGILELLQAGYSVEHLWMANVFREDELVQILESFRTVEWMDANDTLQGNSFKWEVLSPSKTEGSSMSGNDLSVVLLLTVGDTRILFTGDMGFAGESQVIEALQGRQIDILKVAHHGSKNATSEEFLQNTRPKIALLSCGRNNRYGHPHTELLERLEKINAKILRTDKQGMLQFQFHN